MGVINSTWGRRPVRNIALFVLLAALAGTLGGCHLLRRDPEIAPPADVQASEGDYFEVIRVSWAEVEGATLYEVHRAPEQDGRFRKVATTTNTYFDDTDVQLDREYWYRVRAVVAGKRGMLSEQAMGYPGDDPEEVIVPAAPTGLQATVGDHTDRIQVRWNSVDGATSYEVHRQDDGEGPFTKIADVSAPNPPDVVSYTDTNVVSGRGYSYRIRACAPAGCSPLSPSSAWGFAGQTPADDEPPSTPRGVRATEGDHDDKVQISWFASAGATYYEVWRIEEEDAIAVEDDQYERIDRETAENVVGYERIATTENTEWDDEVDDDNDLEGCVWYRYRIRACNDAGCSDLSRADPGYVGPSDLAPPQVEVTETSDKKIVIEWDEVFGADEYVVVIVGDGDETVTDTKFEHIFDYPNGHPEPEAEYTYRVRAVSDFVECGDSSLSSPVTGTRGGRPVAPVLESAEAEQKENDNGDWYVELTWTWTWNPDESPNPVEWFTVLRNGADYEEDLDIGYDWYTNGEADEEHADEYFGKLPGDLPGDETIYYFIWRDENVQTASTYTYRVRAENDHNGRLSGERTANVPSD